MITIREGKTKITVVFDEINYLWVKFISLQITDVFHLFQNQVLIYVLLYSRSTMTDISLPECINQHRHLIHSKADLLQVFVCWYIHSKGYQIKDKNEVRHSLSWRQNFSLLFTLDSTSNGHDKRNGSECYSAIFQ